MSDQNPAAGAAAGDGTGATGTSTPTVEELQKQLADSEAKNATLREERRTDRATALGAEHGLTPTAVGLLSQIPVDQQEEKAKALAAEMGKPAAPATPASQGGNPPPEGAGDPAADPAVDAMATAGGTTPVPTGGDGAQTSWQAEMAAEMGALDPGDFEGMKAIQAKYQSRSRDEG